MVNILDLGKASYKDVWELQLKLVEKRRLDKIPDTIVFVEHPHVITIGKHGSESNIKVPLNKLNNMGIEFFRVDRGGDVTYHGPGQLVGYTIFKIKGHIGGLRKFIYYIEDSIIEVLKDYGIKANRNPKIVGVWVGNDKIAAIGLALTDSVTYHGFALNINTDLDFFNMIVPCGLASKGVTSMERILQKKLNLKEVKLKIAEKLTENWRKRLLS